MKRNLNVTKETLKKFGILFNEAFNRKCAKNSFINKLLSMVNLPLTPKKLQMNLIFFFSEIGEKIKADISPTSAKPGDYLSKSCLIFLNLDLYIPDEGIDIINSLQCKSCLNIDSLNYKPIKT